MIDSGIAANGRVVLSQEDDQALRRSASDVSDIDPQTLARAQAGFSRAYEVARLIAEGQLDPLSA